MMGLASVLLVQQLPLEPVLWGETTACCALAQYCPMSARPQDGMRAGADCEMKRAAACSIRSTCPTGRHDSDGTLSLNALARPAVLEASGWTQALVIEAASPLVEDAFIAPAGKSPPTPPPRS